MTDLREQTIALLSEALSAWEILDSAPVAPAPRPQVLVASVWEPLDFQGPPHRDMTRACALRILCSWPVASGASGGAWAETADALERAIWAVLMRDNGWLVVAEPEGWKSERGVDRLDAGLLARLDIEIRCNLPWGETDLSPDDLEAIDATIAWGAEEPVQAAGIVAATKEG